MSFEESGNTDRHARRRAHLVPVVGGEEEAITWSNVNSLHSSILEKRVFIVIRGYKLYGAVVAGKALVPWVDPLPVIRCNDGEVFIAFVHTHHVLHAVSVGFSQSAVSVPVGDHADVHEIVHQLWQLYVLLQNARRVFERVVVVVLTVFLSKFS